MVNNIPDKVTWYVSSIQYRIYPYVAGMHAVTAQRAPAYCPPCIPFPPADRCGDSPSEIFSIEIIENFPQIVKSSLHMNAELSKIPLPLFQTGTVFTNKFTDEVCTAFPCFNETGYLIDDLIRSIEKHPVHSDRNRIAFCSY